MGVALYIVPEQAIEGFDHFVNGKDLGFAPPGMLDSIAEKAGVRPLIEYFGIDPDEAVSFCESVNDELLPHSFPPPDWFSAEEGLVTVRGMIQHLTSHPATVPNVEGILGDLREFETVLAGLARAGVRWHLSVDI